MPNKILAKITQFQELAYIKIKGTGMAKTNQIKVNFSPKSIG
jgi:hypothetical protein